MSGPEPAWWRHRDDPLALQGIMAGHLWTLVKGDPPDPAWYHDEIDAITDHLKTLEFPWPATS